MTPSGPQSDKPVSSGSDWTESGFGTKLVGPVGEAGSSRSLHQPTDVSQNLHANDQTIPGSAETERAYPIFDRHGKVARMIRVDSPDDRPARFEPVGARRDEQAEQPALGEDPISFCGMVATNPQLLALFRLIQRVAASTATVLIYGESGTGKELVARAIHECSGRRGAFVPVDCGALPENLLESELFGHARGAFTGAIQHKKGLFEEAHGGTLFLDEIGDTTLAVQSKLLRALQEGEIRSVGKTRAIKVNVRVVAATNTSLREAIARKTFREDLYYRLAVIPLRVPPLRERREDILPLARYFIDRAAAAAEKGPMALAPDAADRLRHLPWRGNVRELENVIERAVLISPGNVIGSDSLLTEGETIGSAPSSPETRTSADAGHLPVVLDEVRSRVERERIIRAIRGNQGNKSLAARALGISRSSLYNKLKRYQISPHDSSGSNQ